MSKLSAKQRDKLPAKFFGGPDRSYPINDLTHARMALAMVAKWGTPAEKARVQAAVKKRYPEIEQGE